MTKRSNQEKIERARLIISAATNGELSLKLQQLGIAPEILQEGQALCLHCDTTQRSQAAAHAASIECTQAVRTQTSTVQTQYANLVKTARAIFRGDRAAQQRLGIVSRRRAAVPVAVDTATPHTDDAPTTRRAARVTDSLAIFLNSARQLYDSALHHAPTLEALAKFGYAQQRMERERNDVATLEVFDVEQERLKAVAKASTAEHYAAVDALHTWTMRFEGVVVPALSDRPDLVNAMGLKPMRRARATK